MNTAKKTSEITVQFTNAALLHSLSVCIFGGFITCASHVFAQDSGTTNAPKPRPAYEQSYQKAITDEQKKYDAALSACASKIAPAQCKRQARLSKDQAIHAAKLLRASAKSDANRVEQTKKAAQAPKASKPHTKPHATGIKKPLANKTPPPKGKHTSGALSAQPSSDARRAHIAKQAKLEENVAQRKIHANKKSAEREAKNQKRREAGYVVDAKPAP